MSRNKKTKFYDDFDEDEFEGEGFERVEVELIGSVIDQYSQLIGLVLETLGLLVQGFFVLFPGSDQITEFYWN